MNCRQNSEKGCLVASISRQRFVVEQVIACTDNVLLDLRLELKKTWFDLLLECTTWDLTRDDPFYLGLDLDLVTLLVTGIIVTLSHLCCQPPTHGSLFDHKVLSSGFHMMQLEGKAHGYPAQGYIIELWNYIMAFPQQHVSWVIPSLDCLWANALQMVIRSVCTMWTNPSYRRERKSNTYWIFRILKYVWTLQCIAILCSSHDRHYITMLLLCNYIAVVFTYSCSSFA
jgi:hypothetical protein